MMITADDFRWMVATLAEVARDDIQWSENTKDPESPEEFALDAIFVICNSGMKHTIARGIFNRCRDAIQSGASASTVFGHKGKAVAIDSIWAQRQTHYEGFLRAPTPADKVEFCGGLPWIGGITKFHLAKNFGIDVAKPDVHLQRLALRERTTVQAMCERLGAEVDLKARTVDLILWRACATGLVDSVTGDMPTR